MLGSKSFNFETPNVIDPGEQAPSRPARREKSDGKSMEKQAPKDNSPSTDRRLRSFNTTVLLDPNKGIDNISKPSSSSPSWDNDFGFSPRSSHFEIKGCDDDESEEDSDDDDLSMDTERQAINTRSATTKLDMEYGEMDDDEFDRAVDSELPSVEEARMFAATILQETDRRDLSPPGASRPGSLKKFLSSRSLGAGLRGNTYNLHDGIIQTPPVYRPKRRVQFCRNWLMYVILAILFIVFFVSVAIGKRQMDQRDASDRFRALRTFVVSQKISQKRDLTNKRSPQYLAAQWIADEDDLKLFIPDGTQAEQDTTSLVQRYVLAVFYFSLEGEGWTDSMKFLTEEHECGWFQKVVGVSGDQPATSSASASEKAPIDYRYNQTNTDQGVICNDDLEVRNLIFASNNLSGSIPKEIGFLSRMDVINLSGNSIGSLIPESIGNLERLVYLNLNYNELTGNIPTALSDLSNLVILGLSHNALDGTIPEEMSSLRTMQSLAIDSNLITGDIGPVFGMVHLEYLYADNNHLEADENHLERFSEMNNLLELDLSHNELQLTKDSYLPDSLFDRPNLRVLDLSGNVQLGGKLPTTLVENSQLNFLSLRSTSTSGSIPLAISNLRALRHLDLEDNSITGEMSTEIGRMETLTYLFLGRNPFTEDEIPSNFDRLVNLRELSLDGTQRTGQIHPWYLVSWIDLKLLDLRNNEMTGSIPSEFSKLSDLTYLLLSNNSFTGTIPREFEDMSDLSVVAMHNNGVQGDLSDVLCHDGDNALDLLTTDCSSIECSCCSTCCTEGDEECYGTVVWDRLKFHSASWEEMFARSNYSFDPKLLDRNVDYSE